MLWFGKKKKSAPVMQYDPNTMKAILHCSICNGEQVAGFKEKETGIFTEIMLIKNDADLEEFKTLYHVEEITKEY